MTGCPVGSGALHTFVPLCSPGEDGTAPQDIGTAADGRPSGVGRSTRCRRLVDRVHHSGPGPGADVSLAELTDRGYHMLPLWFLQSTERDVGDK